MNKLSKQQKRANMAAIRSKDTKPEMIVRRGLWKRGFRYRLNHKRLPGHPDLVLRKYRTCIFVNGCFWHGHSAASPQAALQRASGGWTYIVRSVVRFRRRTESSWWRRFAGTRNGTRRSRRNWRQWVGIASRYGSVS